MAKVCHILVAKTAEQMAEELYEELAKKNGFFAKHPVRQLWVNDTWPKLIDQARSLLVSMLGLPEVDQKTKDEIYDALLKDSPLRGKTAHSGRA